MGSPMVDYFEVVRYHGKVVRVTGVDASGNPLCDVPVTFFGLEVLANETGEATFRVHGSRVRIIDTSDGVRG